MAISLSKMQTKIATAVVEWEDESVDIGYFPAAMTPALIEQVQAAANDDNLDIMGTMLAPLLAWWDVLDDDGERLPTTPEQIKQMPMAFSMKVLTAIQEAMSIPGRKG